MKNIIFPILFILLFSRCDFYRSKYPISEESHFEIPEELLGSWFHLDTVDNFILPNYQLEVFEFENKKCLLTETYFKNKKIEHVDYQKVWISKIEDKEYINAQFLRPGSTDFFIIHKYRLGENGILETTFLRDSFKLEFEDQSDFYKYVKTNSEEFDSYFHTPWFSYQRLNSIKWGLVNSLWKKEILQVYKLNQQIEMERFLNMTDEDLKLILNNENQDYVLDILENSFLSGFQSTNNEPFFKLKPWFCVLEKKDGTYVKMAVSRFNIYDVTNNHGYHRK